MSPKFKGALVLKAKDQWVHNDKNEMLEWGTVDYDTDGFFSTSHSTRLTIPTGSGITKVRLMGSVVWEQNAVGMRQLVIKKNFHKNPPAGFSDGNPVLTVLPNSRTTTDMQLSTPVLNVSEGDHFELVVFQTPNDVALAVKKATGTWFAIEAVEFS
jgi:hypothetical protein